MATERKERRGTDGEHAVFTGAAQEITANVDTDRLHIHDAVKAGGHPHALLKDVQNLAGVAALASGTNNLTLTLDPAPAAYATYQEFVFEAANNNTGAVTININSLGVKSVNKGAGTTPLEADDLQAGAIYRIAYNGAQFQLMNNVDGRERPPILLESVSIASAQTSIDLTADWDDTDFDEIQVRFANLHLASAADLYGRVRSGGAFKSAATDYGYGYQKSEVNQGDGTGAFSTGAAQLKLSDGTVTAADSSFAGVVRVFKPTDTGFYTTVMFDVQAYHAANRPSRLMGVGWYKNNLSPAAVDGFRLIASTGNIDEAIVAAYGIKYT